ncbi:MAG: type VI secretion system ATPase TssH, partial [Ruminococcus sp.]|nr:type VI secretion system ATPase TssH [Ruminococcus sp.]
LRREEISNIVRLMLTELDGRLADRRIDVEVSDKAMEQVIEQGFDPAFGARPLKRFIQRNIETLIAHKILSGDIQPDSVVTVDYDNEFTVTSAAK